ncbi:MAG: TPM domain-containing protein [Myxococcales bacterium]
MRTSTLLTALVALLACSIAAAVPPERIPDPRPGSRVVDLTGTLQVKDLQAIDEQAERGKAGGELVVVVIDSVDGAVPREYTTRLFNRWRLDSGSRNKGVLLLAALKDRKAEIVVGDGFASGVASFTDAVMNGTVVPHFKAGHPREALVAGATALVDKLLLASEAPTVALARDREADTARASQNAPSPGTPSPMTPLSRAPIPAGPSPTSPDDEPPLLDRLARTADDNPLPVWGGLGGALLGGFLGVRRYLRNKPRICPSCHVPMVRLDEATDDAHLSAGEQKEEELGSVDYDIWMCECGQVTKERYGAFFTSYSRCPRCSYKTVHSTSRTLRAATYDHSGTAEVTEDCKHCSYHRTYTRTIPRRERPKPTTRSSSSFGGSSRSSGGGSSSGRGSSGSW